MKRRRKVPPGAPDANARPSADLVEIESARLAVEGNEDGRIFFTLQELEDRILAGIARRFVHGFEELAHGHLVARLKLQRLPSTTTNQHDETELDIVMLVSNDDGDIVIVLSIQQNSDRFDHDVFTFLFRGRPDAAPCVASKHIIGDFAKSVNPGSLVAERMPRPSVQAATHERTTTMAQQHHDIPNHASTPGEEAAVLTGEGIDAAEDSTAKDRAELAAIGAEIEQIKESVSHIAEATSHYVKRRVAENSTDLIAENPVRAALWAAFAGFLIGRLSR